MNAQESDLYKGFNGSWEIQGNEYYVAKDSANAFVEHIFSNSVRILGVDGFFLSSATTEPILEVIADCSSQPPSQSDLIQFIDATKDQVSHFNFVLDTNDC